MNNSETYCINYMNRFNTFNHFIEPRSFTRVIDIERELKLDSIVYLCDFEVSIKLWENDERCPEFDSCSRVEAYDAGGHQVRDTAILGRLDAMAELYCKDNLVDLAEQSMKEGK